MNRMSARTRSALFQSLGDSSTSSPDTSPDRRGTARSRVTRSAASARSWYAESSSDDLHKSPDRSARMRRIGLSPRTSATPRYTRATPAARATAERSRATPAARPAAERGRAAPAYRAPPTTRTTTATRARKQAFPMKYYPTEVHALQARTQSLIPRLPFSRLVRELMLSHSATVTRITPEALEGLQFACEMYMTQRLQDAYMLTIHRGRLTLSIKDLKLLEMIKILH